MKETNGLQERKKTKGVQIRETESGVAKEGGNGKFLRVGTADWWQHKGSKQKGQRGKVLVPPLQGTVSGGDPRGSLSLDAVRNTAGGKRGRV